MPEDTDDQRPELRGFQRWLHENRAKIWIWVIGGVALGGVACMFLVVIVLIVQR